MTIRDEILKAVETFKAEQLSISSVEILLSELVRIANDIQPDVGVMVWPEKCDLEMAKNL